MDSGMIGKILKAKQYAEERERIEFTEFSAIIHGENNDHTIRYTHGQWTCTCRYFALHRLCSHTMALEHVLEGMLRPANGQQPSAEPVCEEATV